MRISEKDLPKTYKQKGRPDDVETNKEFTSLLQNEGNAVDFNELAEGDSAKP